MSNMNIPAGFGFVAGRGQERARQVLDATEAAGLDPQTVLTRGGGYLAPEKAIEIIVQQDAEAAAVDAKLSEQGSDEDAAAKAAAEQEAAEKAAAEAAAEAEAKAKADAEAKAKAEADAVIQSNAAKFAEATDEQKAAAAAEKPAGNASTEVVAAWATKHFGYDAAEGLSRSDLIARYGA